MFIVFLVGWQARGCDEACVRHVDSLVSCVLRHIKNVDVKLSLHYIENNFRVACLGSPGHVSECVCPCACMYVW